MKKGSKKALNKLGKWLKGEMNGMKKSMKRAQTGKDHTGHLVPKKTMRMY